MIDVTVQNVVNEIDVNVSCENTNIDFVIATETFNIDCVVSPTIQANKGNDGYTPIKGVDYFDGEKGDKGEQGIAGINGLDGQQGIQGVQGERGLQGIAGVNGTNGLDGAKGDTGLQGIQGVKGDTGEQGIQGIQGLKGDKGDVGEQGIQGIQGTNGEDAIPAGLNRQIQFNDNDTFGAASNVEIGNEGNLVLKSLDTQPTAPISGKVQIYARNRAGADWLEYQRDNGREIPLQHHFGVNRIGMWLPSTSTTVTISGMPRTGVGTVSHPTLAATNLSTSIRRWRVTSAATASAPADERAPATMVWRGNNSELGGWTYTNRFSLAIINATSKNFFGMLASISALAGTQSLTALVNCIGMGCEQGVDTNWQVYYNDASGVTSKMDMGASFPANSTTNVYTLFIYSSKNDSGIWLRCTEEVSGAVFEHFFTTDIPSVTTFLSIRNYMSNGITASAVAYECSGVYLESDY